MVKRVQQDDERRRHIRFTDHFFVNTKICLDPVPPLYGEPAYGQLIDLSAGGMALLLPEALPKKVFLKMTLTFPDGFQVDSVVCVCHIYRQSSTGQFLHGIEFLNLSPEAVEKINIMTRDSLLCQQRVNINDPLKCDPACSLYPFCNRRPREASPVKPVEIGIEASGELADWNAFITEFKKRLE